MQPRSNRDQNVRSTMFCYSLHKEAILRPAPQSLRSGTEKAMDSAARRARSCRMVRHPSTGWNLLMAGADRLDGDTDTAVVSQRSESGQGILGAKEGRGMLVWSAVVVAVLSSAQCAMPRHKAIPVICRLFPGKTMCGVMHLGARY